MPGPLIDEDLHLRGGGGDARALAGGGKPCRGQQVGGEAGRDHQRGVQAVAVHGLLRLGQGHDLEVQPARHRRGGQQAGLDLLSDLEPLGSGRGAPVLIDHRDGQAAQVSQRVGR